MEEYQEVANNLREDGNKAFQDGNYQEAIDLYSQALEVDPDNHLVVSNRSAAYLKLGEKSKALHDAEKCVQLAPTWAKGFSRLGAAQQSLRRFEAAIESFTKCIELEPDGKAHWSALSLCKEAFEADKKERFRIAAIERAQEEERQRKLEEARQAALGVEAKKAEEDLLSDFFADITSKPAEATVAPGTSTDTNTAATNDTASANDEDLLSSFFADVTNATAAKEVDEAPKAVEEDTSAGPIYTEKYMKQDLGDGREQVNRITAPNFTFRNLNPYFVLQLDIDATDEDIKYRYRKLSARVHPDKLRDMENAREAFEEVKKAYQRLCDPDQKKTIVSHIEFVVEETNKERKKLLSKSGVTESSLPPLESVIQKETMRLFAEVEMNRRRSEQNLRKYNAREKIGEDELRKKEEKEEEFEKNWSAEDRREKRVGNWRDFKEAPDVKKAKVATYREEKRNDSKHGTVDTQEWRKSWR